MLNSISRDNSPGTSTDRLAERLYFTSLHQKKVSEQRTVNDLDDRRIQDIKPLIPPQILMEEIPVTERAIKTIQQTRLDAERIIKGRDDRLIVIVGPCSIHDVTAALEYARKLKSYVDTPRSPDGLGEVRVSDYLLIIMRVYFEKPRTTVGWKGLLNDPYLDGSFQINNGLRIARSLLLEINNLHSDHGCDIGLPCANEMLDTISPQFIADLISWAAIGARTTESQVHRELASGLSCAVGFKNGTDGSTQIASDAIRASKESHHFLSVTKHGLSAIVQTKGNDATHVILRGGAKGTNYDRQSVYVVAQKLKQDSINHRVMVDCSHGNSSKDYKKQRVVCEDIAAQLSADPSSEKYTGDSICGVMIESNLVEGRQNISNKDTPGGLTYGQSITDACVGWDETVLLLDLLCKAVHSRRQKHQ
ncbi:hypothetical protein MIR68_012062 [Amoeboaphelidium protococcarum]|nr:hypothetical protein MIR68_012062 [Amoeboaphelidium protococcarum]